MTDPLSAHPSRPQKKSIFSRPLLVGCFGFILLAVLLIGGGLLWLFTTGKTVITDKIREEIIAEIETADLGGEQRSALITEINRITEGFQSGEISMKQMVLIADELGQSPAMRIIQLTGSENDPLADRDIAPDEKADAMLTINRFVYGVFEERIPESAMDDVINPLLAGNNESEEYDQMKFRSDITDAELRSALRKAKDYADRANIGIANIEPDIAREVRETVDRILAEQD
ncbi:hypothetical protein VDG1235_2549 [Verrucomicrobiia bacterium DG1235]|nr:hypothetical protein VDG1235_2549 [Verrucomicrobiae bacterium DG1235]